jgi:hypothetical protein
MNSYSKIHERSNLIPIVQNYPTIKKEEKNVLSLKQNFFDPTKSSPPNDFLLKLRLRMSYYDSFIKDDNLNNE